MDRSGLVGPTAAVCPGAIRCTVQGVHRLLCVHTEQEPSDVHKRETKGGVMDTADMVGRTGVFDSDGKDMRRDVPMVL